MKNKHIVLIIVLFSISVGFTKTEASVLSTAFSKLSNVTSLSSKVSVNNEDSTINSFTNKKNYLKVESIVRNDNSIPLSQKIDNSFTVTTNMAGQDLSINLNFRIIGGTLYFQVPNAPFDILFPSLVPYKNKWISINKSDIDYISQDIPGLKITANDIKNNQTLNQTQENGILYLMKRYDKALSLRKHGTRTVNGIVQDRYIVTVNKKMIAKLISEDLTKNKPGTTQSDKSELKKSIEKSISSLNFKSELIYIGKKDKLPYEFAGIIQKLGSKNKVKSTMRINIVLSDFGAYFDDIVIPTDYMTATSFYNNVIKPMLVKPIVG
jgi:hypothetical protein